MTARQPLDAAQQADPLGRGASVDAHAGSYLLAGAAGTDTPWHLDRSGSVRIAGPHRGARQGLAGSQRPVRA
jgi:hypothetical protein